MAMYACLYVYMAMYVGLRVCNVMFIWLYMAVYLGIYVCLCVAVYVLYACMHVWMYGCITTRGNLNQPH